MCNFSPQLEYIDVIATDAKNKGNHTIYTGDFRTRDNRKHVDMQFGFIKINLTNPEQYSGLRISP